MHCLDSKLRTKLDDVCQKARDKAEEAARSALQKRAVDAAESHAHFTPAEKELRNRLRARGRLAGDIRDEKKKTQTIEQLTQELANEYWHRMIFARFLAENHLLMHPDGVAVSLEECEELAKSEGAANGFALAARYASKMLPQIFRTDDVLLEIDFAPEHRLTLEKLLASLPRETFLADDSLGWVYQFWQTAEKKRVNDSGDKIDGRTLPAVTQLFTEHYMVEFLLHNTIGAWWCAKEGIQGPPGGAGIPAGRCPVEMPYLRWRDDSTPAAGKFEGWSKTLAEFTMLDPCCGSGHFLVAAFNLLVPLRMHDEGLSATEACEAVLRDNIFGLELDPRCTQIAAFALALAAWKYPDAGGYRRLPTLNIACSGQGVTGKKDEWLALANGNDRLREGMDRLYDLFQQAPHLGSLIDPRHDSGGLLEAGYAELRPLLAAALAQHEADVDLTAVGIAAQGIATAAEFLARHFTLVATNVPYKGKGELQVVITDYIDRHLSSGSPDLATAFMLRCGELCQRFGSVAAVTKQEPLFLVTYKALRRELLTGSCWNLVARLGPRAFETITGERVNVALIVLTADMPRDSQLFTGWDVSESKTPSAKAMRLLSAPPMVASQSAQLNNPDARLTLDAQKSMPLLQEVANSSAGMLTGDGQQFLRFFWETKTLGSEWEYLQSGVTKSEYYGGRSQIVLWENGKGALYRYAESVKHLNTAVQRWRTGQDVWGKQGVVVTCMGSLSCTLYRGDRYDNNVGVICPTDEELLPALWAYCSSPDFRAAIKRIDQKVNVTAATFAKVTFDREYWMSVAAEKYPDGLPQPYSNDPTQWIFKGDISTSTNPLQVAVARLLDYHWPEQPKANDSIDTLADSDGTVCLPGVRGEPAAAERLLEVLHSGYCESRSDSVLHKLLTEAGCKPGTTLDDWLRNQFFEQHCKLFQSRPFIWHIWDGRKDGFSALVNYHKLTHKALENLTYSYLGDWITAQSKSDKAGADLRLAAAQALQEKLKLILAGEPPHDIFVRWKPLHEQSIGWHPNLNDGVRMNIRPFVEADILRKKPNIKWTKDRGKEPERPKADFPWFWEGKTFTGERVNDVHLSNAEKQAARAAKGVK